MKSSKKYHLKIPEIQGRWILGSCKVWLSLNDKTLHLSIFNPFTRAQIRYPHAKSVLDHLRNYPAGYIRRVVLSGDPSSPDCLVAVIFSDYDRLAICRLGEERPWSVATSNPESYAGELYRQYEDVIFYQGKLFAVQKHWGFTVFKYSQHCDLSYDENIKLPWRDPEWVVSSRYLVELCGQLFLVNRFIKMKKDIISRPQKTWLFEVYVLKPDGKSWSRVNDLGERSLFLGLNHSIFVSAKEFPWFKPNCIYFTQHNWNRHGYQWDNGVHSLEDNSFIEKYDIQHSLSFLPTSALWYLPKI